MSHVLDASKQRRPVRHMLEHLDRHHTVELALRPKRIGIGGDHAEIGDAACRNLALDEAALGVRIGDRQNAALREIARHPQRERSPAAAKLEYGLSVREPRMHRGLGKRVLLSFGQGGRVARIEAARILAGRPEHEAEEFGRHFVMLGVGHFGMHRDRPLLHGAGKVRRGVGRLAVKRLGRAPDQRLDRPFRHLIWHRRPLERTDGGGFQAHG